MRAIYIYFVFLDTIVDILREIVEKISNGDLRPNITKVLKDLTEETLEELNKLSRQNVGKTVLVLE